MFKKISLYFISLIFVSTTIGSAFAVTLKASHQWPGTPRADGSYDVRPVSYTHLTLPTMRTV